MTDADPWIFLREIGHALHLAAWVAILEPENRGCESINSGSISDEIERLTGESRRHQSIHTSMHRLLDAGVIGREPDDDVPNGYDWRTTERGRRVAEDFAQQWCVALENRLDDLPLASICLVIADDEVTDGPRVVSRRRAPPCR